MRHRTSEGEHPEVEPRDPFSYRTSERLDPPNLHNSAEHITVPEKVLGSLGKYLLW